MEWIMEIFWEMLFCALGVALTAIGTKVASVLGKVWKEKAGTEQVYRVAKASVAAVEMIYREAKGEEKLEKAMESAEKMLSEKGIGITKESLRIWLEAALAEWKGAFDKG